MRIFQYPDILIYNVHNRLQLDIICLLTVEALGRDHERLSQVADHANVCPLGSGAIAGSTLPLDRAYTAKALGFVDQTGEPRITANGMDAVADRDDFPGICNGLCELFITPFQISGRCDFVEFLRVRIHSITR